MTAKSAWIRTASAAIVACGLGFAGVSSSLAAADPLEGRITELHQKLNITADQEKLWKAVAETMRGNAEASRKLVGERRANEATMTAADDLHAYADIAEAHAKHVRKLAKAFDALYAAMSDDQKKVADQVFRDHKGKAVAAAASDGSK